MEPCRSYRGRRRSRRDELRDDGDDLAFFSAEEERFSSHALLLVPFHEEGNEHISVNDDANASDSTSMFARFGDLGDERRRNCS